jgi:hypothetical protein
MSTQYDTPTQQVPYRQAPATSAAARPGSASGAWLGGHKLRLWTTG